MSTGELVPKCPLEFPPRPSDEYDSAPSRKFTRHFGSFSLVSVNIHAFSTLNQAGPDITKDSDITIFQPPVNIPREIRSSFNGLKIGVDRNWTNYKVDSKISGLFKEKLKYLENKGISTIKN